MSDLFSPLTLRGVTFRNRIGVSPMCQYCSTDGVATPWHHQHLGSRAAGGAGMVMVEATAVEPDGRITPACAGLWNDDQAQALEPIVKFISDMGAVPAIQIGHAGRKASAAVPWDGGAHLKNEDGGWDIVGPSGEAFDDDGVRLWKAPKALSEKEILDIQDAFVATAKRALAAGFKLLEIHGAHGYLLHSFFTPLVNKRNDAYGGDLRGRARMMLETVEKVRDVWPDELPLAVRLSASDWIEGGLGVEENIQMAQWVKERGVDIVDCSGGGATPAARASVGSRTADQVDLSAKIRKESGIATMAVGEITTAKQAEAIISEGKADIAMMARQQLRDPYWPMHAAKELGVNAKDFLPPQLGFFVG